MEQLSDHRIVAADCTRASIAQLVLEPVNERARRVGSIELRDHQLSAIARVRNSIREFGGALLCDPVGTGKTYVALALIPDEACALVVAPAILRDMWTRAAALAGREVEFASFESLSRGRQPASVFDFVIVDEAHHARNPATRRYRLLCEVVSRADVVLLTATPVHNRTRDLHSLLSLFLGKRAVALTGAELSRCVIRRGHLLTSIDGFPTAQAPVWFTIGEDAHIPEMLLSLPPPVPPRDGGDGGALVAHSLIRQWASSDAALLGAIQRRIVRAESIAAALGDGSWPTKSELSSWISGDEAVQLSLSGLLSSPADGTSRLGEAVRAHAEGLREIRCRVRKSSSDIERIELIRRIRVMHSGVSVVAFSQHADTVNALFARLSVDGHVAVLTGTGARVTGGSLGRAEVIGRFAPHASGKLAPHRSQAVTLLLTTDLLSEGLNLQDAGVVIHLDLPWTPSRMEQRLGRIARAGSSHRCVHAYAIHPPVSTDEITRIEEILRRKIDAAGIAAAEFPSLNGWDLPQARRGHPAIDEEIRSRLRRWMSVSGGPSQAADRIASGIRSDSRGFLAAVVDGDRVRLIAAIDEVVREEPSAILQAIHSCDGTERQVPVAEAREAESAIHAFLEAEHSVGSARVSSVPMARARNAAIRRVNRFAQVARPHTRAVAAASAETARRILRGNLNAHQEKELDRISSLDTGEAEWIDQVLAVGSSVRRPESSRLERPQIRAMILLGS